MELESNGNKLKIDLKVLEDDKMRNFEERLKFIDMYVEWLKKTPNSDLSELHKELIDRKYKIKTKRAATKCTARSVFSI